MDGVSLAELESRHAACVAARKQMARDYELKDMGYAYVLGEYEQLIKLAQENAARAAEAERLEAERLLTTLAEPERIAEVGAE